MLGFLPPFVRGAIALVLLTVNTLFWCALLFVLALVKLVLPFKAVRLRLDPMLNAVAMAWVTCNTAWMKLTQRTTWDVQGVDELPFRAGTWSTATTSRGWTFLCCSAR